MLNQGIPIDTSSKTANGNPAQYSASSNSRTGEYAANDGLGGSGEYASKPSFNGTQWGGKQFGGSLAAAKTKRGRRGQGGDNNRR